MVVVYWLDGLTIKTVFVLFLPFLSSIDERCAIEIRSGFDLSYVNLSLCLAMPLVSGRFASRLEAAAYCWEFGFADLFLVCSLIVSKLSSQTQCLLFHEAAD